MGFRRGQLVWLRLAYGMLAVVLIAGCAATVPRNTPTSALAADKAVVPGIPHARIWGDVAPVDLVAEIDKHMPSLKRLAQSARIVDGRPHVTIMALSGGGPGGAFGAGLLKGWTAHGTRPKFDVVTGVSAGAIIAPFAFLGPAYDAQLEHIWTRYETNELVVAQILPAILGGPALADTGPLQQLIEHYVDRRFLRAVAAEHVRGRMLLIGTTNLDAERPVYWNMGEIAASRHPRALELFRKVIMASAAIPGAFPPVTIEVEAEGRLVEELHVDGGTTRDVFVAPAQLKLSALDRLYPKPPKRHIYIIMNGKMTPEFKPVKATAVAIGARAISTLIKSHDSGDLYRISQQAAESGATFNFVSIPSSFTVEAKQAFDPIYQRALFEAGEALGRSGGGWRGGLSEHPQPASAR
ncbi:MAG: patatin-like phospholipase family protein [Hyphomicrobiaceae bacterium]|nr:patatin-like phospholipase family protein [Hyphomicrobiaceae bacterium]